MLDSNLGRALRRLAHWAGVILGILVGVAYFQYGIQAFFVGGSADWPSFILWLASVIALLSLLPISVLGIFRPRLAAYSIVVSWAVLGISDGVVWPLYSGQRWGFSLSTLTRLLLLGVVPCFAVMGLLFYGSTSETGPSGRSDRRQNLSRTSLNGIRFQSLLRRLAQLHDAGDEFSRRGLARATAVIFGLLVGGLGFRWGLYFVLRAARADDWLSAIGLSAVSLALLPLSALGFFMPRRAAYGILVSLSAVLAWLLFLSLSPPFTMAEAFSKILLALCVSFPFVTVAALLLFASANRRQRP